MFRPLALFVGLRYVRARSQKYFVSFIAWVALLGVALGVAALIVVISVMNGFEQDLRSRLISLSAHARLTPTTPEATAALREPLRQRLLQASEVLSVVPYVEAQALAVSNGRSLPVQLRGIDPALEASASALANNVVVGELTDLAAESGRVLLGGLLAQQLELGRGDALTLMVPAIDANGVPQPRVREFEVAGVFEVGIQDTDAVVILMHLSDARVMAGDEPRSGGWRLRFADLMQASEQLQRLQSRLPPGLEARAWSDDHASYFRAIRIEKTMMGLILMLIVAIAAFNLVAMLVMVVNDKRTDIAILRTFGATPGTVQGVFVTQGVVIGWLGVGLGVAAGVAIAKNATAVANFVERVFGFQFMNPDVYYVTQIPTDLRWPNVVLIGALALLLTTLAVLYPARRAAGVAPAEALRYE